MIFNNKRKIVMLCSIGLAISLSACSQTPSPEIQTEQTEIVENTNPTVNRIYSPKTVEDGYTYNLKQDDQREFVIELKNDGKYTFTEKKTSETVGVGVWHTEGDIMTLTQTSGYPIVNKFKVDKETLTFVKEGSSNFPFEILKDGDIYVQTSLL